MNSVNYSDADFQFLSGKVNEKKAHFNLSMAMVSIIWNENFGLLPISIVYRILSKSEEIPNDLLFDFISKSIEERCTLFNFLIIQNLSDIKLKPPAFLFL